MSGEDPNLSVVSICKYDTYAAWRRVQLPIVLYALSRV